MPKEFDDDGVVLLGPTDLAVEQAGRPLRPVAALTTGDKFQLLGNTVGLLTQAVAAAVGVEAKKALDGELVETCKLLADFVRSETLGLDEE